MQLTISGYSTALFSTWYFVEELSLLLDAGDGVISNLLQKSRKIKWAFISHADRDHLTGLLQLNQLNARPTFPKIFFPKDSKSIVTLEKFSKTFDKHVDDTEWIPLEEGQEIEIKKDVIVTPVKNSHVISGDSVIKSCGYLVEFRKYKLRQEYIGLPQKDIIQLRKDLGDDAVMLEVRDKIIGYSGDTPVENFNVWNNTEILIHEATFLEPYDITDDERAGKHSILEDVIKACSEISIKVLILGHFSSRYNNEDIDNCIISCCRKYSVQFPVYRMLPAQYLHNILNTEPVYNEKNK